MSLPPVPDGSSLHALLTASLGAPILLPPPTLAHSSASASTNATEAAAAEALSEPKPKKQQRPLPPPLSPPPPPPKGAKRRKVAGGSEDIAAPRRSILSQQAHSLASAALARNAQRSPASLLAADPALFRAFGTTFLPLTQPPAFLAALVAGSAHGGGPQLFALTSSRVALLAPGLPLDAGAPRGPLPCALGVLPESRRVVGVARATEPGRAWALVWETAAATTVPATGIAPAETFALPHGVEAGGVACSEQLLAVVAPFREQRIAIWSLAPGMPRVELATIALGMGVVPASLRFGDAAGDASDRTLSLVGASGTASVGVLDFSCTWHIDRAHSLPERAPTAPAITPTATAAAAAVAVDKDVQLFHGGQRFIAKTEGGVALASTTGREPTRYLRMGGFSSATVIGESLFVTQNNGKTGRARLWNACIASTTMDSQPANPLAAFHGISAVCGAAGMLYMLDFDGVLRAFDVTGPHPAQGQPLWALHTGWKQHDFHTILFCYD